MRAQANQLKLCAALLAQCILPLLFLFSFCSRLLLPPMQQEAEPKLPNLLKLLVWAQKQLDEKAVYPRIENLTSAELVEPPPADD